MQENLEKSICNLYWPSEAAMKNHSVCHKNVRNVLVESHFIVVTDVFCKIKDNFQKNNENSQVVENLKLLNASSFEILDLLGCDACFLNIFTFT